ncbi:MAG: four helix bundle protein [Nitrospirae bacterium]|nr:four helix bundle protein [Nitrospirota bacterium]
MLKTYKDLEVWQKAYAFCLKIYQATKDFPAGEKYGLTSQIRRAAISISSNIAEGYGRKNLPEYIQFLHIAYGSLCELETQILLCGDLSFISKAETEKLTENISTIERMLKALIRSFEKKRLGNAY